MRKYSIIIIYIALFFSVSLQAQRQAQLINKIFVVNTKGEEVGAQLVYATISMKEKKPFTREMIAKDIKSLRATGIYEKVDIQVKKNKDGKLDAYVILNLRPTVTDITFKGNHLIRTKRLRKKLSITIGQPLNLKHLGEDLAAMTEYYEKKGYYGTRIIEKIERKGGKAKVTFQVNEKARHKIWDTEFTGNKALSSRKLRGEIETHVSFWGRIGFSTGYLNHFELQRDLDKMKLAYWNIGYLDAEITVKVKLKNNHYYLSFTVDEGKPYKISKVSLTGNKLFTNEEIMKGFKFKEGDVYSFEKVQVARDYLKSIYNRKGYLDMFSNLEESPDGKANNIEISIRVIEGKESHIRDINISNNKVTHDKVIRRELPILPGDLSDGRKIESARRRLENLGYFEYVEAVAVDVEDGLKDLNITVKEKDTGSLSFGVGFSDLDRMTGQVEIGQSNFNLDGIENIHDFRKWSTMKGGGQRVTAGITAGSTTKRAKINFTEPWLLDRPIRMDYSAWFSDSENFLEDD